MKSIRQWLDEHHNRKYELGNHFLYLGAFIATTLFGGSLFAMMLYASASATPQSVLLLMQAPFKGGLNFFVIFNSLMEWILLPTILYLNWHVQNRWRLLIVGAALYYFSRIWTYVYFVPIIFGFMSMPVGKPLSAELVSQMMQWVNLSWIRCGIDGILATSLLFATSKPSVSNS